MKLFRISIHTDAHYMTVRLNDSCVIENTGVHEISIQEQEEHIVQWFVRGPKGSSYSIVISHPSDAEFQLTRIIGESTKDFGGFRFTI